MLLPLLINLNMFTAPRPPFGMDYGTYTQPRRRKDKPQPVTEDTYDEEIAVLLLKG